MFISKKKYNELVGRIERLESNSDILKSRVKHNEKLITYIRRKMFDISSDLGKIKAAAKEATAKITQDLDNR